MKNGLIIDKQGVKRWYKNDLLHREDGPATIWITGTKLWCQNDHLHRLDGPAIEYSSGDKFWYYQGKRINCNSQQEFEIFLKFKAFY